MNEPYTACEAAGFRTDETAGTVSGVAEGIAFRLTVATGALEMSVSIADKHLPKLQKQLAERYADATVVRHNFGVLVTLPAVCTLSGDALFDCLTTCTRQAAALAGADCKDTFEKDRESPLAYLLGAIVGVLPWFLCKWLLGWQLWIFGAAVSVASFFGYRYLWGAHQTGFAVGCIVVSSLLAIPAGQFVSTLLSSLSEHSLADALALCLTPEWLWGIVQQSAFGLIACALGLAGIRSKVMTYTHESIYMRRRGRRR